jgi:uncharacterized protein YfaT (DUF1175 family)
MGSPPSRLRLLTLVFIVTVFLLGRVLGRRISPARAGSPRLLIEPTGLLLPADGEASAPLSLRAANGRTPALQDIHVEMVEGGRHARIVSVMARGERIEVVVEAGILPGQAVVEANAKGFVPARVQLAAVATSSDRWRDGTPDFLRLTSEADRRAFRTWFAFLAEAQGFRVPGELPSEINDCAALIRFAYREALREHGGAWASELGLEMIPGAASVEKYQYPFTPLGAGLFRVRPGVYQPEDAANGAFAQFADAKTLWRLNTHFVSRDVRLARPGDLLFFRQLAQSLPFHAMIFLGRSQFESGDKDWVIYHTGPMGKSAGEVRRVRLGELLEHPSPRWRPLEGNANFLGVYRWNILQGNE